MMPSPLPPSEEVVLCCARQGSNALQAATVPTSIHARPTGASSRLQVSEARFPVQSTPSGRRWTLVAPGTLQGVPPPGLRTPCSGCGVAWVRADHRVWRGGNDAQAAGANLPVEGAEESLSILPDCTPAVRPPPKRS
jgi:hypothetical protein